MKHTRHTTLEFKFASDAELDAGKLVGYGARYGNIDQAGDIIAPGAFKKSIQEKIGNNRYFPFLNQHNSSEPIGVIKNIHEDGGGLRIEVELNLEVQKGREVRALIKQGAITGLSVGFNIVKGERQADGTYLIKEARLWEVSAVTFPCNELAVIESIKAKAEEDLTQDEDQPQDEVADPEEEGQKDPVEEAAGDELSTPEQPAANPALVLLDQLDAVVLPSTLSKGDWVFLVEDLRSLLRDAIQLEELDKEINGMEALTETAQDPATDEAEPDADASTDEQPLDQDELTDEEREAFRKFFESTLTVK